MRMLYWSDQNAGSPHSSRVRSGHPSGERNTPALHLDGFAWRLTYLAGAVAPSETETVTAAPISNKQIQHLPIRRYDTIRDDIQAGDLLFCSGSYFFSHAIQKLTRLVWSHVGLIYKDPTLQRVFVLESETLIGVPFNLRDDDVSPDDIWLDDEVQLRYRIM